VSTGETSKAPGATKVTFYVGLARPEDAAAQALRKASDPDASGYRRFPSRSTIAGDYGAHRWALRAVRDSASGAGLSVKLDETGVFAAVSGTAKQMRNWTGQPVMQQRADRDGLQVTLLVTGGRPPKAVRSAITEYVPLDLRVTRTALSYSGTNAGSPRSCLPGVAPDVSRYTYSYDQLRTAYGLDALPRSVKVGKRTRVAILAQGQGFSRDALAASAFCFRLPEMRFTRVPVPGLTAALQPGVEGDLDTQVVQAVLPPGSRVTVVEASAVDERDFLAWATAFSQKHLPHVATTSYGYCEQDLGAIGGEVLSLTESVLRRLSLAGTTVFAAAGDRGSSDCVNNATGRGSRAKAVDYPASSPHVTAVGGTRIALDARNRRAREVVWNSTALAAPLGPQATAGGGGTSRIFDRPWWQDGVTGSARRVVPDVAAHSADAPAWPLMSVNRRGEVRVGSVGGTSAAAPFVAASVAVIAAEQQVPFGLLQPALYALPPSALYDITEGTNDLFDRGCCRAKVGFDQASGLGAPRFDRWLSDLPKAR
jgi:kumamolisin